MSQTELSANILHFEIILPSIMCMSGGLVAIRNSLVSDVCSCSCAFVFLTDANTGVLRLWNVSNPSPVENMRLKKTGFRTLLVLPNVELPVSTNSNSGSSDAGIDQAKDNVNKTSSSKSFTVPAARILSTFLDGGVGLYDLRKRKWIFLREMVRVNCQYLTWLKVYQL